MKYRLTFLFQISGISQDLVTALAQSIAPDLCVESSAASGNALELEVNRALTSDELGMIPKVVSAALVQCQKI